MFPFLIPKPKLLSGDTVWRYTVSTLDVMLYIIVIIMIRMRSANLYVLHEAVALPTARQGLPGRSDGREGDLHQLIHTWNIRHTEGWGLLLNLARAESKRKKKVHFDAHFLQEVQGSATRGSNFWVRNVEKILNAHSTVTVKVMYW